MYQLHTERTGVSIRGAQGAIEDVVSNQAIDTEELSRRALEWLLQASPAKAGKILSGAEWDFITRIR